MKFPRIILICFAAIAISYNCENRNSEVKNSYEPISIDTSTVLGGDHYSTESSKTARQESNLDPMDYMSFTSSVVQLLEGKIIIDSDFNSLVGAKIKNNTRLEIVAVELIIDPRGVIANGVYQENPYNRDCDELLVRKKISIKPTKTGVVRERVKPAASVGCKLDFAVISFGDIVFSNGKSYNLKSIFGVEALLDDTK